MFIQLFSELSEADIQLLGKFNRKSHFRIDLEHFRKREVAPGLFGLEEVVPLVNRLEARGLISEMPNAKLYFQRWSENDSNRRYNLEFNEKLVLLIAILHDLYIFL